jgi:hypothetical protein
MKPNRALRPTLLTLSLCSLAPASCGEASTSSGNAQGFRITASGELLAQQGYWFPPTADQEVFFADGWSLSFDKVLVVVDHVHLSKTPDLSPTDPAQTGDVIAELEGGPIALDLAASGAGSVAAKRPGERAWVLGELDRTADGACFDSAERYAFGYAFVPAQAEGVKLIGFEGDDPDWAEMVQHGYTHLLVATATRSAAVDTCQISNDFDFGSLPTTVRLRLGLTLPVSNVNCQNPELTAEAIQGEESQRGVQGSESELKDVQITLHTDHLFWAGIDHGGIPLFNHLAARAVTGADGLPTVTVAELQEAPLAPVISNTAEALGWMSCVDDADYRLPSTPAVMTMDTEGLAELTDLASFIAYNASTMGHLNQDGLCFVAGFEPQHSGG